MQSLIAHTIRIRIPNAQHVALIGDFNNWHTTAHPLSQIAPALWERAVTLLPGKHRYAFFVIEDHRKTAGTLRSRIEASGAVLWVPENPDLALSVTSYPAEPVARLQKPALLSA